MSSHESDVKAKQQLIDHAESFEKDHDANLSDHSSMGSPVPHFLTDENTKKTRPKQKNTYFRGIFCDIDSDCVIFY